MRKVELAIGAAALVLISVTATLYIVNHKPAAQSGDDNISEVPPSAEKVLSPSDVLSTPSESATPAPSDEDNAASAGLALDSAGRGKVVYPDWQPGTTAISGAHAVTEKGGFIAPQWSPIGLDIAAQKSDGSGLYLASASGTAAQLLTANIKEGEPFSWNPDGMSLHIKDPDGVSVDLMITGEKYPVLELPPKVFEQDGLIYFQTGNDQRSQVSGTQDQFMNPKLSPDETKVVFEGRETGIYFCSVDGSAMVSVGKGANPSWLPDSSGIVFDLPVSDGSTILDGDIYYASVDGRELTNLTNSPGIVESHPAVAPDGQTIAFISDEAIYVAKLTRHNRESEN